MNKLRILALAPDCTPEGVSIPFVAYCHAAALAEMHDVTLVIRSKVEAPVRRAGAPFRELQVVQMRKLERAFAWCFRVLLRSNWDSQLLTALSCPFGLAFEWLAWRRLRRRIAAGEFDVVLRLLPMSPALPSLFPSLLRGSGVPFVAGPLNGGLRSAAGFSQADEKGKIWWLRWLARRMPYGRSTYRHAAAIVIASNHMRHEFAAYADKLFFIPENGIAESRCMGPEAAKESGGGLDLIFVGGLVPRKACYVALRAAAPLLRAGRARFTVIGDGPERDRLEDLVRSLGIEHTVSFCGWLGHEEVLTRLRSADVAVLPAVREGGGGVVFEALASGVVPVVLDHGGPGDIVYSGVGYKVPPTNEAEVVSRIAAILELLAADRILLARLQDEGLAYARGCLTWEAKARSSTLVMRWARGECSRPDLSPAAMHSAGVAFARRAQGPGGRDGAMAVGRDRPGTGELVSGAAE